MEEWAVWTVIDHKMATLTEIETSWTFDDLVRALDYIKIKCELEERERKTCLNRP